MAEVNVLPLEEIVATVIHTRGETSMAMIPQGDWARMQAAIDEVWLRPGARWIWVGTMRIENSPPTPYPDPIEIPPQPPSAQPLPSGDESE